MNEENYLQITDPPFWVEWKKKAEKWDQWSMGHYRMTTRERLRELIQTEKKFKAAKKHIMKVKFESNHFPLSYDGKFLMIDYEWVEPIPYWEELLKILGNSEFKEKDE